MAYDERYPLKDYLNSINQTKENLLDGEDPAWEKNYPSYVINKCMSHHIDTVMLANEMNQWGQLPTKMQYDFFINTVRSRKRFSPWSKKEKMNDLEIVKQYYGYSNEKARQALSILTPEQLSFIKTKLNKGGKKR
jgi:hypothetical protein|tara:strand:+ start:6883 stop:7287 length:405 start_codon:yes stop_codon:yes gene_type:complete